jgi:hypothetical protein
MDRIMKVIRLKAIAAATAALLFTGTAHAATLFNTQILASSTQNGTYTTSLVVTPGQTVYYEVVGQLAPVGTSNTKGTINTITSADGANSLSYTLTDSTSNPVQISFNSDAALQSGFTGGSGANAGTASGNSLTLVRPIQAPGVQAGGLTQTLIETGTFLVSAAAPAGSTGVVTGSYAGKATGLKINAGANSVLLVNSDSASDPVLGFAPLTLTTAADVSAVPAPGLLGSSALTAGTIGLVGLVRRRRLILA